MVAEPDNNDDKFKKVKKKFEDYTQSLKDAKTLLDETQNHLEFVSENLVRATWDGDYIKNVFNKFAEHPKILKNDLFNDRLDFLDGELSGGFDDIKDIQSHVKKSYDDYTYLSGAVSQSSVNMGTGAIGLYEFFNEYKKVYPIPTLDINSPEENPYRKVKNLNINLDKIHYSLTPKVDEISKSVTIMSKMKHLNNVAHQIREFISHFLQMCDPDNNVKTTIWVEFSNGKKPTQKSRCIYAIIGTQPRTAISKPVENIAEEYRDLYNKLSGLAHLREKSLYPKRVIQIKTYYNQFLQITEAILDLRDLHFLT